MNCVSACWRIHTAQPEEEAVSPNKPTPRKAAPKSMAKPAPKTAAKPAVRTRSAAKPARQTKSAGLLSRRGGRRSSSTPPAPRLPSWQFQGLSAERKLDILGGALALVGLLSLLALLSSEHGLLTGWWVAFLYKAAGWGALVLPVLLVGFGLWLVFRNVERLPVLSGERSLGLILLFLNLLTWLHLLFGGGWELASAGRGGGYVGGALERLLVSTLGGPGAVVALIAWLILGLALALDVTVPELLGWLRPLWERVRQPAPEAESRSTEASAPAGEPPVYTPLPPEYAPLPQRGGGVRPASAAQSPLPAAAPSAGGPVSEASQPVEGARPAAAPVPAVPAVSIAWTLPAVEAILDPPTPAAVQNTSNQERARLIEETLASFGAPCHVVEVNPGPTVTQFGVEPDFVETRTGRTRVRVGKIASLADDLALALAAPRIRIQAPVPGRSYVGIEVPNLEISRVSLREVIESERFQRLRSGLRFALGKDVAGHPAAYDLSSMPHLLIAGTTGSGKSVCVNAILAGFLLNNTPSDLRLVLVDPKRVELTGYNGIPHLLAPVVVEADRVIGALQWMMREMDSRYHKFSRSGVRNIQEFNTRFPAEKLPYLVVVIDELADLMMLSPDETERTITRLAQLARATGIHLILATQRPSVDVVTGLIKANFPARVAFMVASGIDSRVILDQPGAERLLGRGDMLFQAPDASAPVRLQGVYVSDVEIQRVVDYWRDESARLGSTSGTPQPMSSGEWIPAGVPLHQGALWADMEEGGDPLMKDAVDLVRREGRASITMLQRRMRIGYTRAARLIDAMEEKGIVGPVQPNTQVREVLDYGPTAPPEDDGA